MSESEGKRTYEVELDPPMLKTTVEASGEEVAMDAALDTFKRQIQDGTWSVREVAP